MKTTVQVGRELENYVVELFKRIYPKAKRSKGSGNKGQAGDIAGQDMFVVECKKRQTKNITIKEDVWKKLNNEIPLHSTRLPLYILENANGVRLAVLDVDHFFNILSVYMEE